MVSVHVEKIASDNANNTKKVKIVDNSNKEQTSLNRESEFGEKNSSSSATAFRRASLGPTITTTTLIQKPSSIPLFTQSNDTKERSKLPSHPHFLHKLDSRLRVLPPIPSQRQSPSSSSSSFVTNHNNTSTVPQSSKVCASSEQIVSPPSQHTIVHAEMNTGSNHSNPSSLSLSSNTLNSFGRTSSVSPRRSFPHLLLDSIPETSDINTIAHSSNQSQKI
jgi:hypothetical protein